MFISALASTLVKSDQYGSDLDYCLGQLVIWVSDANLDDPGLQ